MAGLHPTLAEAIDELGIRDQVPSLVAAANQSEALIEEGRQFLRHHHPLPSQLDVVVVGSLGRRERRAGAAGDLDHFVVVYGLPDDPTDTRELLSTIDRLAKRWKLDRPGGTGMFGPVVVAAPDLTERIGLEQDTNLTHSRRILLLQESVSLYQPDRHQPASRIDVGPVSGRRRRERAEELETRRELREEFRASEERGRALQSALEVLFFESTLAERAKRFLTF